MVKMARAATISTILFIIFVVAPPGFSGSIGAGKGHVGNSHKLTPHHRFNYRSPAYGHVRNHELKFNTLKKHLKHPPRFFYDPRFVFYGGRQSEKTKKLEITLKISNSEKNEPVEHPVKKERPVPPPHMATVPGLASDESDSESVILIRGTQISN
jgi:hypothetical protein